MSYVDLGGPHTAASRDPAQCEARNLGVTAKVVATAAGEADTLAGCLELGYDLYVFGICSGTDLMFEADE